MTEIMNLIPILIPIVIIDLFLRIYTIVDIFKIDRKVKGGNKYLWAIICGVISLGWVVYLIIGKDE